MKKILLLTLIILTFCLPANAIEIPNDLKDFLKNKFPGISFRIDSSFEINKEIYLPLIPAKITPTKKIEIVYLIPEKSLPKLIWFSNDWIFVKVIKDKNGAQTILDIKEIAPKYKEKFLKAKLPSDIVIPKEFFVKNSLSSLVGNLPVKIIEEEQATNTQEPITKINGTLYLTSPDTGKIVYFDTQDLSMIQQIQTMGAPWEITFDKNNKLIYISDFAKDKIYKLKLHENTILKTFELSAMSSPKDIKLSDDGSLVYIIESLAYDFAVYKTNELQQFIKTKLPPNPSDFAILKNINLLAITCPTTNRLVFLNANDFSRANQIILDGGPEKIIADQKRNLFYIANRNLNIVSVVDGNNKKLVHTINVGETPTSLTIDPESKYLYVGNGKSNTISIVDLESQTVVDTITLPVETQFPGDMVITEDSNWLIISSETTNIISIIDLIQKKIAKKIDVGTTTHSALLIRKENQ